MIAFLKKSVIMRGHVILIIGVQGCKSVEHKTYSHRDDQLVKLTTSQAFHYFWARRD